MELDLDIFKIPVVACKLVPTKSRSPCKAKSPVAAVTVALPPTMKSPVDVRVPATVKAPDDKVKRSSSVSKPMVVLSKTKLSISALVILTSDEVEVKLVVPSMLNELACISEAASIAPSVSMLPVAAVIVARPPT